MMWDFWEFIVSGRLPGTAIQITFEIWLKAMGMAVVTVIAIRLVSAILRRKHAAVPSLDGSQITERQAA